MAERCILPYGSRPYVVEFPANFTTCVVDPPADSPAGPVADPTGDPAQRAAGSIESLLEHALDCPIGAERLEDSVASRARVVVAVSDATRDDPRSAMVHALLRRLPDDIDLTIAVANGTHGRSEIEALGIEQALLRRARIVNHDAHDDTDMVTLGVTERGTPVRIHRCVVEADWVIATGRIKPHYFAGYGAGCKSIFPGLGGNREIRINHRLKQEPGARPGVVHGNPCRDDLEEAVAMVPARRFLLNLVIDPYGRARAAVAGDIREAFLVGAGVCEPLYRVEAPRARLVIVSDGLPLSGSLYQASKLVAATADLLCDGGTMIVVAECPDGIGPVDTVNRGIYEIGLAPRLPANHRIVLVSEVARAQVAESYCEWAPSVSAVLDEFAGESVQATVVRRAGCLIVDAME